MKLIAENEHEAEILECVCWLLNDLGIHASGVDTNNAAALIYWTVEDLPDDTSLPEREALLAAIEEDLYTSMIIAGYDVIQRSISGATTIRLNLH